MAGGPGVRFAVEAAFLIAVAVAAGLAELSATTIVLVMGAAWLLVATIEWLAWREGPRVTRVRHEAAPALPAEAPPSTVEPEAEVGRRRRFWRRRRTEEPAPEPESPPSPAVPITTAGEDTQDLAPPQEEEEPAVVPADERRGA
jgi:hypothetical protein